MIDALHDRKSVNSDTVQALQLKTVKWLIYHDYGLGPAPSATKLVADEFVDAGLLDCGVGSPPAPARPFSARDNVPAQGGVIGSWQHSGPEGLM